MAPTKLPCSYPFTFVLRPSSSSLAPSSMPLAIKPSTRSTAAQEITGPISVPASTPAFTFSVLAVSTISAIHSFAAPTNTTTDNAIQRCPAAPNAAPARLLMVCCLLASGSTIAWFFAPIMHCTRLPANVAR